MRVPVAEALPSVAEALLPGCGGSARFLQKQSQLLVLGLSLEFDKRKFKSCLGTKAKTKSHQTGAVFTKKITSVEKFCNCDFFGFVLRSAVSSC